MELDRSKLNPELVKMLDRAASMRAQAAQLIERAKLVDQQIVDNFCAFTVGDVVTVTGFAHSGKDMAVASVHLGYNSEFSAPDASSPRHLIRVPYFVARGPVLLKNGATGVWSATAVFDLNNNPAPGVYL